MTTNENGLRVLRWIETQGVVFYAGKAEREKAKLFFQDMPVVFPELFCRLNAIFLFVQGEQSCTKYDGNLWKDCTTDGTGILYAVGIAVEALNSGKEYAQFVFLHELAHIQTPDHGKEFDANLNQLIIRFNESTGSNLYSFDSTTERQ